MMKYPIIIAEACCNHMGDIELAKKMIIQAKESGANIIKFQKRDIDSWIKHNPTIYLAPHPNPINAFGETYETHRRFLEFEVNDHFELKKLCDEIGISYMCSVFDVISADNIIKLKPYAIKIPSSCNTNFELIEYIISHFDGEIHISFGMTSKDKIDEIMNYFSQHNRLKDLIIYACTSAYPLPLSETCLLEIKYLSERYGDKVKGIGYSGHHQGIIIDIAAYTLGAVYLERHFTLDREFKGTDQKMSITPLELRTLVQNLKDVSACLTYKNGSVLPSEISNMEKLKW